MVTVFKMVGLKPDVGGSSTYLSGPMTNLPDYNWPVFIMAEKHMDGNVFNPAKPHGYIIKKSKTAFTWSDFMVEDVYNLLQCNDVVVLPGWSKSTGAVVEVKIGEKLLNTKPMPLRDSIGLDKYLHFISDVKEQYYKDGNNRGYDSVIEPMLMSKAEHEAAKYVSSYVPPMNEGVIDSIRNMIMSMKEFSILNILKIIGFALDKKYSQKVVR
jgi:hypothetical protein